MKFRQLGNTKLKVSEIGIGTWQLAGDPGAWAWASSDADQSYKSLLKFAELGGNFIDTAWVYGHDNSQPDHHPSEQMIGRFLKEHDSRDKFILATKIPPKNWVWPARRGTPISEVFPPDWIAQCTDESLRSLGVDTIDLMQFHVWQDDFVNDDSWKTTIQRLTQVGKVKHWGISINDFQPSNCLKTLETGLISSVQFIFNLWHQKPINTLIPFAAKNKIGLIARVPLDEGGLTGKIDPQTKFVDGDFRNMYFGADRKQQLVDRINKVTPLMGKEANSILELNLRWILSHPELSTVIPGMRKVDHVQANLAFSDGKYLSKKLMQELAKHAWERNFYADPNDPSGGSWVDPALKESGFMEP